MSLLRLQEKLASRGLRIFTVSDFRRALGLSRHTAYVTLARYANQGVLRRLRNGLYRLSWTEVSPLVVANRLYRPSYISYETAMAHHHLIPESVYAVTSATSRRSCEFEEAGRAFIYHSVRRPVFTGYRLVRFGEDPVLMADPEKALCDFLHLVFLKKKALNDRTAWRRIRRRKLLGYSKLYKPAAFARWMKNAVP